MYVTLQIIEKESGIVVCKSFLDFYIYLECVTDTQEFLAEVWDSVVVQGFVSNEDIAKYCIRISDTNKNLLYVETKIKSSEDLNSISKVN
jgi:hypothetical protein